VALPALCGTAPAQRVTSLQLVAWETGVSGQRELLTELVRQFQHQNPDIIICTEWQPAGDAEEWLRRWTDTYREHAPDLVVDLREHGYALANHVAGSQPAEILPGRLFSINSGTGGTHTMDAVFAAAGPTMEPRLAIDNASLVDIAPTVLHLMGLPIPGDMDGKVMPVFAKGTELAEKQAQFGRVEEKHFEQRRQRRKERELTR